MDEHADWRMAINLQRQGHLRRLIGGGVMVSVFILLGFFSLPWLLVAPVPPDVAQLPVADVILHWTELSRLHTDEWIVHLYQQGKAKKIVCLSGPVSWDVYAADFTRQHLIDLGIPAAQAETFHLQPEACAVPQIKHVVSYVKTQGWQTALLVTDPTPRAALLQKYFQQEGLSLTITCVPADREELTTQWWKSHWKIQWLVKSGMNRLLDPLYAECR